MRATQAAGVPRVGYTTSARRILCRRVDVGVTYYVGVDIGATYCVALCWPGPASRRPPAREAFPQAPVSGFASRRRRAVCPRAPRRADPPCARGIRRRSGGTLGRVPGGPVDHTESTLSHSPTTRSVWETSSSSPSPPPPPISPNSAPDPYRPLSHLHTTESATGTPLEACTPVPTDRGLSS